MKSWQELQQKVCRLFEGYPGFEPHENHELQGARGKVKVDVFVLHNFGPLSFKVIIECKCWRTRVPQEKAFALKTVVEDTGASMGILLTEKGVQEGCARFIANNTNLIALTYSQLALHLQQGFPHIRGLQVLEEAVSNPESSESYLFKIFSQHTHLLLNLGYEDFVIGPVLRFPKVPIRLAPDFVLKPVLGDLCDILDLRSPAAKLIINSKYGQRVSADMSNAIMQLSWYSDYFDNDQNRSRFFKQYGLHVFRPRMFLFAGRKLPNISDAMALRLVESNWRSARIEILTYDSIIRAAKNKFFRILG